MLLTSPQTIFYVLFAIMQFFLSLVALHLLIRATENFEKDVHSWINQLEIDRVDDNLNIQKKSSRVLIQLASAIPEDILAEISPDSIKLRRYAKVPLVIILVQGAIQVGLDLIFFKFGQ